MWDGEKFIKFVGTVAATDSCYTDNSVEFGKACETLSWIIALRHLIDQTQMASLKKPTNELKKVLQQYCWSQDWTKSGGRIPWDAVAICEVT